MTSLRSDLLIELKKVFDKYGQDPILRDSNVAHFQVNGCFSLAKKLGKDPQQIAGEILNQLDLSSFCDEVNVSGPGFINLKISNDALARYVNDLKKSENLGCNISNSKKIVIDFSSPNVAKDMHVGHLRSTIIGDSLYRMAKFLGHDVIGQNHIGDWGTPFGMLIEYIIEQNVDLDQLDIYLLDALYKRARDKFDADSDFKSKSLARVVSLQAKEGNTYSIWQELVKISLAHFQSIYKELDVNLTEDDVVGESFYASLIQNVLKELEEKNLLVVDQGAKCVFVPGFYNRNNEPLPLILQKKDGGFSYGATDLAALKYRLVTLKADRVIYVVGAPQKEHLKMCFAVAKLAGWATHDEELVHVAFGSVLGEDNKILKSRTGENIKLLDLINEAKALAREIIEEKNPAIDSAVKEIVVSQVAIGAIKYADLSSDVSKDYVFNWKKMLSFDGDTGPYLQYAHARICSILDKAKNYAAGNILITNEHEEALVLKALGFGDMVELSFETFSPHKLCGYLRELAAIFSVFYENCPVIKAEENLRASRISLIVLIRNILATGLNLLGIAAPEKM
jgi:arginyl-tRNA synthetase